MSCVYRIKPCNVTQACVSSYITRIRSRSQSMCVEKVWCVLSWLAFPVVEVFTNIRKWVVSTTWFSDHCHSSERPGSAQCSCARTSTPSSVQQDCEFCICKLTKSTFSLTSDSLLLRIHGPQHNSGTALWLSQKKICFRDLWEGRSPLSWSTGVFCSFPIKWLIHLRKWFDCLLHHTSNYL